MEKRGPYSERMKQPINDSSPIGQVARWFPRAIAVFEEFDIDYACTGGRSVHDAAVGAGFEPIVLLGALEDAAEGGAAPEQSISDLVHTIVIEHHRFEAARFRQLASHFEPPDMTNVLAARIRNLLVSLATSLSEHILREERNLFPHLEELDLHPHRVRAGSISRPLLNEFHEHDAIHEKLTTVRELSLRLRLRPESDTTVLDEIDELYRAVHRHMHLENNVLIPRVIDLENSLKNARKGEFAI